MFYGLCICAHQKSSVTCHINMIDSLQSKSTMRQSVSLSSTRVLSDWEWCLLLPPVGTFSNFLHFCECLNHKIKQLLMQHYGWKQIIYWRKKRLVIYWKKNNNKSRTGIPNFCYILKCTIWHFKCEAKIMKNLTCWLNI